MSADGIARSAIGSPLAWTGSGFINCRDPKPEEIRLEDIARGLSLEARWKPAAERFYSVARHSVMVAELVREAGGGLAAQRFGLLHDAPEAYIGDLPRPWKENLTSFRTAESRLEFAVLRRFGLMSIEIEDYRLAMRCDNLALAIEKPALLPSAPDFPGLLPIPADPPPVLPSDPDSDYRLFMAHASALGLK